MGDSGFAQSSESEAEEGVEKGEDVESSESNSTSRAERLRNQRKQATEQAQAGNSSTNENSASSSEEFSGDSGDRSKKEVNESSSLSGQDGLVTELEVEGYPLNLRDAKGLLNKKSSSVRIERATAELASLLKDELRRDGEDVTIGLLFGEGLLLRAQEEGLDVPELRSHFVEQYDE